MNDDDLRACTLRALVACYRTLTPDSVPQLRELYAADAWFKDPFNEVRGIEAVERIFHHMFVQVSEPRFEIESHIHEGDQAVLIWILHFRDGGRCLRIRGASHLSFDADGKVCRHRDYWDTAEELYGHYPLIGAVLRWLARRLAA